MRVSHVEVGDLHEGLVACVRPLVASLPRCVEIGYPRAAMLTSSRPRLAVAWVFALLAAPVLAQAVTRLLSAWTGEAHVAVVVTLAALVPTLLTGAAALLGATRPWLGWSAAALAGAACLEWTGPLVGLTTAAIAGLVAARVFPRIAAVAPVPRGRLAGALWGVLAVVAVVQGARMSVFMADPTQRWGALAPTEFGARHSCLSSYVHGAALVLADANIYDDRYGSEVGEAPELPSVIDVGPLSMDTYEYPPQFLVLPRALLALTDDFMAIRALWYLLTAAVFVGVGVALARALGGDSERRALLLLPAVWLSPHLLVTVYFGNFQVVAMALSALAMLAIFRGHTRRGAALLAFTISAKIFPGILGVYLLAARRWAAAAWTSLFAGLYAGLALLLLGSKPFVDFFAYHLPRLASGETFAWLSEPSASMSNLGVFGVPFKLRMVGWSGSEADAWALAQQLAWVWTLLVIGLAIRAGWRRVAPTDAPTTAAAISGWFGLLGLAALRSPFAPPEALIPIVWALSLRAAAAEDRGQVRDATLLWIAAMILIPAPGPITAALALSLQALVYGVAVWLALGRRSS